MQPTPFAIRCLSYYLQLCTVNAMRWYLAKDKSKKYVKLKTERNMKPQNANRNDMTNYSIQCERPIYPLSADVKKDED